MLVGPEDRHCHRRIPRQVTAVTRLNVRKEEYFQIIKASVTEIRCIDVWPVPWVQCSHRAEFAVSQNTSDSLPQSLIRKVPGNRLQESTKLWLLCWFEYKKRLGALSIWKVLLREYFVRLRSTLFLCLSLLLSNRRFD